MSQARREALAEVARDDDLAVRISLGGVDDLRASTRGLTALAGLTLSVQSQNAGGA